MFDLYLISDRRLLRSRPEAFEEIARELPRGSVAFQLREKELGGRALFALAEEVLRRVRPYGAKVFVNDRADVARAAGADGVHLATSSIAAGDAARLGLALGASAHSREEICAAEGVDFFVFGPVFETPSKARYGPPVGLAALSAATAATARPVYALGGVRREVIPELIARGARGVAVISAVLGDPDPPARARELVEAVRRCRAAL